MKRSELKSLALGLALAVAAALAACGGGQPEPVTPDKTSVADKVPAKPDVEADKPAPDKPAPDKPAPDKPAPDKPAPDKPAPVKPAPDKPAPVKPAPAPDQTEAAATKIPHSLEGQEACTGCHKLQAAAERQEREMPADHNGRTDDVCQSCHSASEPQA